MVNTGDVYKYGLLIGTVYILSNSESHIIGLRQVRKGMQVCRYNWLVLEAILSNSTRKLLRFEITKMLIAV